MVYLILLVGLVIMGTGFILTENNAKYLLSGYNTMTPEERAKVDAKGLVKFFNTYSRILGIVLIAVGLALYYLVGTDAAMYALMAISILGYIPLIWQSQKYYKSQKSSSSKWLGVGALLTSGAFVAGLFYYGSRTNDIKSLPDRIAIDGMYGTTILRDNIQDILLVESLPAIKVRLNGYSVGNKHKGLYRTQDGERVRLITQSPDDSAIKILLKSGKSIYYNHPDHSAAEIMRRIE